MSFAVGDLIETWDGDLGLVVHVEDDMSRLLNKDSIPLSQWCEVGLKVLISPTWMSVDETLDPPHIMFLYADTIKLRFRRVDQSASSRY